MFSVNTQKMNMKAEEEEDIKMRCGMFLKSRRSVDGRSLRGAALLQEGKMVDVQSSSLETPPRATVHRAFRELLQVAEPHLKPAASRLNAIRIDFQA